MFDERENNKKGKTNKVRWEGKLCLLFLGMEVAIVFYFIFSSYKLRLITFGSILLFIMIINAISRVFFKKTYIYIYKSFFVIWHHQNIGCKAHTSSKFLIHRPKCFLEIQPHFYPPTLKLGRPRLEPTITITDWTHVPDHFRVPCNPAPIFNTGIHLSFSKRCVSVDRRVEGTVPISVSNHSSEFYIRYNRLDGGKKWDAMVWMLRKLNHPPSRVREWRKLHFI